MSGYLASHPDIFMAVKELHYFSEWSTLSEQSYLHYFSGAHGVSRIGEASVNYLTSSGAASAIAQFQPDAKILIMLRHPVEVVAAMHAEALYQGVETIPDLRAALEIEAPRGQLTPAQAATVRYRDRVDWEPHIRRYFELFGRDRVHVVIFDDFRLDTLRSYQEVLRFLRVDESHVPDLKVVNARKQVRSAILHRLILHHPDAIRRLSRSIFPDPLRRRLWKAAMRLNAVPARSTQIDPELAAQLTKEFGPRVGGLGDLLGRDLRAWLSPPSAMS